MAVQTAPAGPRPFGGRPAMAPTGLCTIHTCHILLIVIVAITIMYDQ